MEMEVPVQAMVLSAFSFKGRRNPAFFTPPPAVKEPPFPASCSRSAAAAALLAVLVAFSSPCSSTATALDDATLSNVPQTLSRDDGRAARIQHPKSRKAESCVVKCVATCIRSDGGEGPFNLRRPLVVFKSGFRSRQYCLIECSDICNLMKDGEDGP